MNKTTLFNKNNYIYPSYTHYNGTAGYQDYGNNGIRLKNKLINIWRQHFASGNNIFEMETPTIMPHNILKASGHVDRFTDYVVYDRSGSAFRADHLVKAFVGKEINVDAMSPEELETIINNNKLIDTENNVHITTKNLMFKMSDANNNTSYLRPELAQGIIVNFNRYLQHTNYSMPLGLAQVGKSYRNEISTKYLTRLREFTQAELEFFVDPLQKSNKDILLGLNLNDTVPVYTNNKQGFEEISLQELLDSNQVKSFIMLSFIKRIHVFARCIGLGTIRFRKHEDNEMAHYAVECWDLEACIDDDWLEVIGCADRGIWDCSVHSNSNNGCIDKIIARRQLNEPRTIISKKIVLNKKNIAKKYGKYMKQISEYIDNYDVNNNDCTNIIISLNNDINITLDNDMFEIISVSKIETYEEYTPNIIEPSFGIDRLIYSILMQNTWARNDTSTGIRSVLSLPTNISSYNLAIFVLLDRNDLYEILNEIKNNIGQKYDVYYDYSTTKIGKKYVRSDELGIKFAVTIDVQSLDDKQVTVRERDSMGQVRVAVSNLCEYIDKLLNQ